jgi:hypothetical protein
MAEAVAQEVDGAALPRRTPSTFAIAVFKPA